jgi:hypothetical protein
MIGGFRWAVQLRSILYFFLLGPMLGLGNLWAGDATSRDAYARYDESTKTWAIGTSLVEEKLRFADGAYSLTSLRNKVSGREYVTGGSPSEEFRITVNGDVYTGSKGGWRWKSGDAKVLAQGEILLAVSLENTLLRVEKSYVIYPGSSIIRQWTHYENAGSRAIKVDDPYFLSFRVGAEETNPRVLNYMTGGGYYTGSQILKEVPFSKAYAHTFDSTDKPERTTIGGLNYGSGLPWGSGVYMPWFCIREPAPGSGFYVGFDYYGRWAAEVGNQFGAPGYFGLHIAGYQKDLAPGESIETPKAFTGLFTGDLDAMGNQLKAWQYRYLWDLTSNSYFAKIRFAIELRRRPGGKPIYGGGTQENWDYRLAELFRSVDIIRYLGGDILWQDAGWHDLIGDNDGPDFAQATRYLHKHGMNLTVWLPIYCTVQKESHVYQEHPDWLNDPSAPTTTLDTSKKEVIDYLRNQLKEKETSWGDFQWRQDGSAVEPVNGNQTPMLEQYHNFTNLQQEFRRLYPGSSIDLCSGGGNLMGYESLRVSDVSQLTDSGSLFIANYYSSYLFPPDKIDDWTRDSNFTWEDARSSLTMAAAWFGDHGVTDPEPGLWLNDGLENMRRNFEIYHYLVSQGVGGRWTLVYHPRVEGDDPIFYFQRLSQDGKRGVIVLKHFLKGNVTIYPKGLQADEKYDVRFEMSKRVGMRTGADLMKTGISLLNPAPGEIVYLGLPNVPGSGNDHTPPSDPANVRKRVGTNFTVTGIELRWEPSTDNNWLSYYQIYRDGEMIDKVAKGTYYFDHSNGPSNLSASYQVQAVDGDGNGSRRVEAVKVGGEPVTFTAWGGYLSGKDYSYQEANGWSYEEWTDVMTCSGNTRCHWVSRPARMMWNGARGHMGLYEGAAGTERASIGASWLHPGDSADAVRIFTLPYSGQVTVTGTIHKDIYHTHGDGVRAKVLKGDQQLWPATGWETIAGDNTAGKTMELKMSVVKGDKLYFVVNDNANADDDDTVWNPQITYDQIDTTLERAQRTVIDDANSTVRYTGRGWQELGIGATRDQGYLPGLIKGTLAISGIPGDKMTFKFRGTGVEIIGDTGDNRGVASIALDGKTVATIDTFVPEDGRPGPGVDSVTPTRIPTLWATLSSKRLWGVDGLANGEHTLELTVTGLKNKESAGTFVGIDALVILNGNALSDQQ